MKKYEISILIHFQNNQTSKLKLIPQARTFSFLYIYIVAYSPLGMSSEFRFKGNPVVMQDPVLHQIAKEMNVSPHKLALKFLLQLGDNVIIIPKSTSESHIKENSNLNFAISEENMNKLRSQERCYRLIDSNIWWNNDYYITEFRE